MCYFPTIPKQILQDLSYVWQSGIKMIGKEREKWVAWTTAAAPRANPKSADLLHFIPAVLKWIQHRFIKRFAAEQGRIQRGARGTLTPPLFSKIINVFNFSRRDNEFDYLMPKTVARWGSNNFDMMESFSRHVTTLFWENIGYSRTKVGYSKI